MSNQLGTRVVEDLRFENAIVSGQIVELMVQLLEALSDHVKRFLKVPAAQGKRKGADLMAERSGAADSVGLNHGTVDMGHDVADGRGFNQMHFGFLFRPTQQPAKLLHDLRPLAARP
jgi:hypothetical protein